MPPIASDERTWDVPHLPSWRRAVVSLSRGAGDPTAGRDAEGALWRASRTPVGPVTLRLRALDARRVSAQVWGPGGEWLLMRVPALLGDADDPSGFLAHHDVVAGAALAHSSLRLPRSELLLDTLVPAVLEQRVTSGEAQLSWRQLVVRYGTPAPGAAPAGLYVAPSAERYRSIPSWGWHAAGVDLARSRAIAAACRVVGRLAEALEVVLSQGPLAPGSAREAPDLLTQRLLAVPGIGDWTVAEIRQRACGDPDAISVGDFHLAKDIGWALAGRPVDDDGMIALLAPYFGHRYRAVRLLELSGLRRPRFAPKYSPADFRRR